MDVAEGKKSGAARKDFWSALLGLDGALVGFGAGYKDGSVDERGTVRRTERSFFEMLCGEKEKIF